MAPYIDLTGIPQKVVHVPAGKPIDLNIPIKARPAPVCTWSFNGAKMKDSLDRVKIVSNGKYTKPTVRETTIDDTGSYTLQVKNSVGTATEILKIIILGKCVCFGLCVLMFLYWNILNTTVCLFLSR